ncbi:LTA synthase family protein [Dyadobacter psychrotolerans]|uniref:Alkaline phosphatase family protein n=1 Tax=Dyadobacter psychrotolerans TaxID=2541721 RepID=A0A4R5DTU7_9BACT|nr:alkaline phosphatase family protein [Dyadobacter psychrotolerans]TDE15521.1 alkaline phosphatase family protein [Dyadobacter psychrotolerans]
MRKRLIFIALYGFIWTVLFQFFRIIFLTYHYKKSIELPASYLAESAWHGLRMDVSFAGYILVLPTLFIGFTWKRWDWYKKFITIYTGFVAFVIVFLTIADLELFRAWGFRIDATSLHYLKTPQEAWASMASSPVFALSVLFTVIYFTAYQIFKTFGERTIPFFQKTSWYLSLSVFVLLTGALIIPIRGGLQLAPMNESAVFFSDKSFANYAAVNVPWNYMSSVVHTRYSKKNPFIYQEPKSADSVVASLYSKPVDVRQIINTDKPVNVVVIIWESFTAKAVAGLGGLKGITPQFDSLSKEGILFTNMYASGNRSDKGMVAILSGYPAQPTTSIIKIPNKTISLPSVPKTFHSNGWSTSFYYGGETEFANMKSYFLQQGFDKLIDKNAFASKDMNSKWGAHDHVVFKKLLTDLDTQKQPFFSTMFTLSSHEPFEVPAKTVIKGNDVEHLFLNSLHYSDASLGEFIKDAKTKSWWKNTLLIIIADHGHPLPERKQAKPSEFHIPMLWLGGALKENGIRIDTLCSQTDLASTLLKQLKLPSKSFKWSNDIFSYNRKPFAYFAFNNGFGWIKPGGFIIRDNIGGNITGQEGNLKPTETEIGKAYLQASYTDYLRR